MSNDERTPTNAMTMRELRSASLPPSGAHGTLDGTESLRRWGAPAEVR